MSKSISGLFSGTSGRKSFYRNPPLSENLAKTAKKYKMTKGGYFGRKGRGKNVREIVCKNSPYKEAKKFFKRLTQGYVAKPFPTKYGNGFKVVTDDNTVIVFRPVTSSPKSPAVDIKISATSPAGLKKQKIHFVKKEA